ncbi:hypothetical protein [Leptolyngbya sp. FACHB-261]|uniref:hypothetical protein n=1 Tax=Leptolyngbya sp. FACHB-261 TaxID=2692806 RepID=UPI0016837FBC|nr:hypothetical protein [Leptolyngbya sp. FACHB-261]MBD2101847.1 hypothetical protein [Leptolyngbya sp. FACHB-261]
MKPLDLCHQPLRAAVLLATLSLGMGLVLPQAVLATPHSLPVLELTQAQPDPALPPALLRRVQQDLSNRVGIPATQLRVIAASRQTWTDGCLGLGTLEQLCLQALVEGWRITLSDGRQAWTYRTNADGQVLQLEPPTTSQLPSPSATPSPNPVQQPPAQRPPQSPTGQRPQPEPAPALAEGEVFQAISSGGFAGQTYKTTLMRDGRVIRVLVSSSGAAAQPRTHRVSRRQVQAFQRLLAQQRFDSYKGQNYTAPPGAADFINVTLVSRAGSMGYVDMGQDQLPQPLQTVIRAWNQISSPSQRN